MNIVLGATGHVGSAVARHLLEEKEPVTVVGRDRAKLEAFEEMGARIAIVDVHDAPGLRAVLDHGERLFLLNPPAAPSTDTDVEERRTARAIVAAVEGSKLEKIVAESTYGAQPGAHIGDLGVLHDLEQALGAQPIPTTIVRGAYYMSNWDLALDAVKKEGKLHTFFPADFVLPMVAPRDLGRIAARLMTHRTRGPSIHHVEGPERYTPNDVAAAFSEALKKQVAVEVTPVAQWSGALASMGFSTKAAESFAAMTKKALEAKYPERSTVMHGTTSLQRYVGDLVAGAKH
ncbi:MAG TPA: NmrA family NAD(P)-binding protein [Polyangiaceae bacterium]